MISKLHYCLANYIFVLDKRNTAWLRDTVRQTSLGKSAAGADLRSALRPLTSLGTSAWPYRVTTQYSYYITFFVQKHIIHLVAPSGTLLVRDGLLGAPAFVKLAYSTRSVHKLNWQHVFRDYTFKLTTISPGGQWINTKSLYRPLHSQWWLHYLKIEICYWLKYSGNNHKLCHSQLAIIPGEYELNWLILELR